MLSHPHSPQAFSHPAALIGLGGDVLDANEAGKTLLTETLSDNQAVANHVQIGKPFQLMLASGLLLKATPVADQTAFLLEWLTLTDAEVRLAMLQAVSRSVNSSLILEDIFDSLGEVLRTFIPFASGTIVILDETQNTTKVVVSLDAMGQAELKGDSNLFAGYDVTLDELIQKPQARLIEAPFTPSVLISESARQAILAPLISKGVVIGCIGLSGSEYTQTHVQLLEQVSEQLAVAVENARLYWQTQSQAGREFLINQITKAIRQSLDIQQILDTTVQEVGKVVGISRCLIHYWGDISEETLAEHLAHFEYVLPGVAPLQNPGGFAAFEHALFTRRADSLQQYNPFILNDCRHADLGTDLLTAEAVKSMAIFPILLQERTFVGTISLHQCDTYRAWLDEEIQLLNAIAEHVAVGLHQAHLFQEKENQRRKLEEALLELQQTQMQLIQSEKMAVLGQFVAGIAHEVNTPLGTLMSNDDTVRRCLEQMTVNAEADHKFRQSALDLLNVNAMAADRILEIVKNLRNFARLDESDLKHADLHEGLDATLLLMASSFKGRIRVEKRYGEIPPVACFPGLLNQVFMNMLINAVHSMEDTGSITIETGFDPESQVVTVSIRDTGKGIAPEHLSRIFDPGFTTKGVGVGTGLGLALCYKIVEKHQGRIDVASTVGEGTVMTVCLPVTQQGAAK